MMQCIDVLIWNSIRAQGQSVGLVEQVVQTAKVALQRYADALNAACNQAFHQVDGRFRHPSSPNFAIHTCVGASRNIWLWYTGIRLTNHTVKIRYGIDIARVGWLISLLARKASNDQQSRPDEDYEI